MADFNIRPVVAQTVGFQAQPKDVGRVSVESLLQGLSSFGQGFNTFAQRQTEQQIQQDQLKAVADDTNNPVDLQTARANYEQNKDTYESTIYASAINREASKINAEFAKRVESLTDKDLDENPNIDQTILEEYRTQLGEMTPETVGIKGKHYDKFQAFATSTLAAKREDKRKRDNEAAYFADITSAAEDPLMSFDDRFAMVANSAKARGYDIKDANKSLTKNLVDTMYANRDIGSFSEFLNSKISVSNGTKVEQITGKQLLVRTGMVAEIGKFEKLQARVVREAQAEQLQALEVQEAQAKVMIQSESIALEDALKAGAGVGVIEGYINRIYQADEESARKLIIKNRDLLKAAAMNEGLDFYPGQALIESPIQREDGSAAFNPMIRDADTTQSSKKYAANAAGTAILESLELAASPDERAQIYDMEINRAVKSGSIDVNALLKNIEVTAPLVIQNQDGSTGFNAEKVAYLKAVMKAKEQGAMLDPNASYTVQAMALAYADQTGMAPAEALALADAAEQRRAAGINLLRGSKDARDMVASKAMAKLNRSWSYDLDEDKREGIIMQVMSENPGLGFLADSPDMLADALNAEISRTYEVVEETGFVTSSKYFVKKGPDIRIKDGSGAVVTLDYAKEITAKAIDSGPPGTSYGDTFNTAKSRVSALQGKTGVVPKSPSAADSPQIELKANNAGVLIVQIKKPGASMIEVPVDTVAMRKATAAMKDSNDIAGYYSGLMKAIEDQRSGLANNPSIVKRGSTLAQKRFESRVSTADLPSLSEIRAQKRQLKAGLGAQDLDDEEE